MIYTVPQSYIGRKLLDFLHCELHFSRASVTALKQKPNGITVNGSHVTVRYFLSEGDVINLLTEDSKDDENIAIVPVDIPIEILYEDDDIVVANKPSGMPTHPSHNHQNDTLANALAFYYLSKNKPFVFRAVNRLDRDTSGCVLVAKNKNAAWQLSRAMSSGLIIKKYLAIATGKTDENGVIEKNIRRRQESKIERTVCEGDDGQYAKTVYERISLFGVEDEQLSLLSVTPITGRTHQIRVHLSYIGHAILGDTLYGRADGDIMIQRQALHCSSLTFPLLCGKTVTVTAPLFDDMNSVINGNITKE